MKKMKLTSDKLAEFLFANKGRDSSIDFYEDIGGGQKAWYCAATTTFADAPIVMINCFGGGSLFMRDLSEDDTDTFLKMGLKAYFKQYAIDTVLVDEDAYYAGYHGWVSVDDYLPEPYRSVLVRGGVFGNVSGSPAHWDGEIWRSDTGAPFIGIAQWKLP